MSKKIEINNVKNRFLPIPESVAKGLEPEPKIADFNIKKELGAGSFGRVYLVEHKVTKALYAIKAIDKRNKNNIEEKPYFRREVEVMYKIHHRNVVKLFGHFEDNNYCYFIMEYISKGNLFSLIPKDKKKRLSAQVIASIMKDLICAVYFLHNMNPPIIHRDIKPENILLAEGLVAKLTDFGWSNYIQEDEKRTTVCGTPIYLAPEIIKEKGHDERVDIWCIGVLFFELSTGTVPFQGNDIDTLKNNIVNLKISWPKDINTDAKNIIMKILKSNPDARLPLKDMLNHPFFTKYFPNASKDLVKPDPNQQYRPFIVSKDNPATWDPCVNSNKSSNEISQEKYDDLLKNYESLKNDYDNLSKSGGGNNEINDLKKQIDEKDQRIIHLLKVAKDMGKDPDENGMTAKVNELEKINNELKNKVDEYEKIIKERQGLKMDNKLNQFRDSLTGKDSESYTKAVDNLKNYLDSDTRIKLNEIIQKKEDEIRKFKEEEKIRRDKEKKKFITLINKYDKTLNWVEKENKELKIKIKELESA